VLGPECGHWRPILGSSAAPATLRCHSGTMPSMPYCPRISRGDGYSCPAFTYKPQRPKSAFAGSHSGFVDGDPRYLPVIPHIWNCGRADTAFAGQVETRAIIGSTCSGHPGPGRLLVISAAREMIVCCMPAQSFGASAAWKCLGQRPTPPPEVFSPPGRWEPNGRRPVPCSPTARPGRSCIKPGSGTVHILAQVQKNPVRGEAVLPTKTGVR